MSAIARLHRHVEAGTLGRHVEKHPAMVDFEEVGAELSEPRGDLSKPPGRSGMVRRSVPSTAPAMVRRASVIRASVTVKW